MYGKPKHEGGDILVTAREILVGLSDRTDQAGMDEVADVVSDWGYTVRSLNIPEPETSKAVGVSLKHLPLYTLAKKLLVLLFQKNLWCGRRDSNSHGCYPTATSTLRVYHSATTARDLVSKLAYSERNLRCEEQKRPLTSPSHSVTNWATDKATSTRRQPNGRMDHILWFDRLRHRRF